MRLAPGVLAAAVLGAQAMAQAFEYRFVEPAFVVGVPALPEIGMAMRSPTQAVGSDGEHRIEIVAAKSDKAAISTRECAGLALRRIVARPGMPDRDSIYRAPLDAQTFLVIYPLAGDGARPELHAHLLAGVHGTHCVEAHFVRSVRAGEDDDGWRESFRGARIEPAAR